MEESEGNVKLQKQHTRKTMVTFTTHEKELKPNDATEKNDSKLQRNSRSYSRIVYCTGNTIHYRKPRPSIANLKAIKLPPTAVSTSVLSEESR